MGGIAVIGSGGPVGRRVAERLGVSGTAAVGDAETLLLLEADAGGARRLLVAASAARAVVYTSSAMVYGAWPNNPVPLTEDAPMRPNPGFVFATAKAEIERVALDWREETGGRLAVLRPATVLGEGADDDRLTHMLRDVLPAGVGEDIPPVQYLHGDDLADAVVLAATVGLDGVYNVAPDGWMSEDQAQALTAGPLRLRLPAGLRRRLPWLGPDVPAELLPYLLHPWVVANDRLRAAGWRPRFSSEEAFVVGAGVPRWQSMSLGRRQALAAGGVAGAVGAAVAAGVALSRRRRR